MKLGAARLRSARGFVGLLGAGWALAAVTVAFAGTSSPNDPFFTSGNQWGLAGHAGSADVPPAWCASTGSGVLVADVDTGADFGNPDLAGKLVPGAAFLNGDGTMSGQGQAAVQDDNYNPSMGEYGHGSMTTGLQVANTNNGQGIAGVAPDARALVVKVLDHAGKGYDADVAAGIRYAANYAGVSVINLSIGPEVPITNVPVVGGSAIPGAIQYAASRNIVVAVAAGNNSLPLADYNGVDQYALVVGAMGPAGERAYYSTTGGVNIWAPGGDDASTDGGGPDPQIGPYVVSTAIGGYAAGEGTSFAAPHVAGVAALLAQRNIHGASAISQIRNSGRSTMVSPVLDAGNALNSHASCGPAASGGGPLPGLRGQTSSGAKPPQAPASQPQPAHAAPAPTHAASAPTPSPSPSPSPSASIGPDQSPGPKALAHPPSSAPRGTLPVPAIVAGVVIAGGAAFAGYRFLPGLR